jgi:flavodoxin
MRALVVYESMYGNTHIVANCIAEGLRDKACDVTVMPVNRPQPKWALAPISSSWAARPICTA